LAVVCQKLSRCEEKVGHGVVAELPSSKKTFFSMCSVPQESARRLGGSRLGRAVACDHLPDFVFANEAENLPSLESTIVAILPSVIKLVAEATSSTVGKNFEINSAHAR
jgi:hypothetical protein